MEILALSLNHRVTPLEVREAIVFHRDEGESFLKQIRDQGQVDEAMLISTCNRTELYAVYEFDGELDRRRVFIDLLGQTRDFAATEHPRNYEVVRNEEAVRHLFRVTAGLESQRLIATFSVCVISRREFALRSDAAIKGRGMIFPNTANS